MAEYIQSKMQAIGVGDIVELNPASKQLFEELLRIDRLYYETLRTCWKRNPKTRRRLLEKVRTHEIYSN